VVDGIPEEHKVHVFRRLAVVDLEVFIELVIKYFHIVYFLILFVVVGVVSEQQTTHFLQLHFLVQVVFELGLQLGEEPVAVILIHQPVIEHSLILMHPQVQQSFFVR
jgi:hypothetical protein